MEHHDETFDHAEVQLDGNIFTGCSFRRCTLVYRAEAGFIFNANYLDAIKLRFEGAAEQTLFCLQELYHSGELGRELIEKTFENVRKRRYKSPS